MSTNFVPARMEAVRLLNTGAAVNCSAMNVTFNARNRKIVLKQKGKGLSNMRMRET
jgi:hypothetical protein